MDENLQKQVQARMEELPEDVRKAIMAADLDQRIQAVGRKHHLHIDQIGKLGDETLMVMLAFSEPTEFARNLVHQLGISQEEAEGIATDVSNDIFMPIRESMQNFVEQRNLLTVLAEESTPPPASVPQRSPSPASSAPTTPMPPPPKPASVPPVPVAGATTVPALVSKPQVPLAPHPHDLTLLEKTITTPAAPAHTTPAGATSPQKTPLPTPPKPDNYKTDPYREPVEP